MRSSSSCASASGDGASIIMSRPLLFFGNAIKSRIESDPPNSEHMRSKPNAIPPCGGAPYLNAPSRNPNCACAYSGEKPNTSNIRLCTPPSWIRIDPPPTSTPFTTKS